MKRILLPLAVAFLFGSCTTRSATPAGETAIVQALVQTLARPVGHLIVQREYLDSAGISLRDPGSVRFLTERARTLRPATLAAYQAAVPESGDLPPVLGTDASVRWETRALLDSVRARRGVRPDTAAPERVTVPTMLALSRVGVAPDGKQALVFGALGCGALCAEGAFSIGAATVRARADALSPGTTVLDLGSGPGEPSTRILQEASLTTYAVDASPTMVAAFRERLPGVPIERNTVEASDFFNPTFGGVLAWVLMFILDPAAQALVITKVARARATRASSLHRTSAVPGVVGRDDRAPVAISRRGHV